jgi:hypothetical protein
MIRKRLSITEEQNRALQQKAEEEGVSEDEVARRALDTLLHDENESASSPSSSQRPDAAGRLVEHSRQVARDHSFPEEYRFSREATYQDRSQRWLSADPPADE